MTAIGFSCSCRCVSAGKVRSFLWDFPCCCIVSRSSRGNSTRPLPQARVAHFCDCAAPQLACSARRVETNRNLLIVTQQRQQLQRAGIWRCWSVCEHPSSQNVAFGSAGEPQPFFLIAGKFKTPVLFQLAAEFLQDSNLEAGVCL